MTSVVGLTEVIDLAPVTDLQTQGNQTLTEILAAVGGGGGGGGSGTAGITVIDSNPAGTLVNPVTGGQGNLFTSITSTSTGSPVITYYRFGTTTVATPVGNVYPYTTEYGQTSIVGNGVMAAVKASSTSPVTTDPALVVALSPNGGQATAALQTSGNTLLAGIATNQATSALQEAGNQTLTQILAALGSNGGSLYVDTSISATATNTISSLAKTPKDPLAVIITVNGQSLYAGINFTVSGKAVTISSGQITATGYNIATTDTLTAIYSY